MRTRHMRRRNLMRRVKEQRREQRLKILAAHPQEPRPAVGPIPSSVFHQVWRTIRERAQRQAT